jgi:signal transduction histidine kinase
MVSKNNFELEPELERIERNVVRCDHIIEELLDFTRLQEKNFDPVDIDLWLSELIDEQSVPDAMTVTTNLKSEAIVYIDNESFRRAVINVIQNGIQAMAKVKLDKMSEQSGKRNMEMTVESRVQKDRVELVIADSGEGIPQANLEKIYEPLYSTKSFGVGLGLPIVKGIMEQHLGGIIIDSQVGVGTKVTLWLPTKKGK